MYLDVTCLQLKRTSESSDGDVSDTHFFKKAIIVTCEGKNITYIPQMKTGFTPLSPFEKTTNMEKNVTYIPYNCTYKPKNVRMTFKCDFLEETRQNQTSHLYIKKYI